eukprot:scaffold4986_cov98-Skeletonema_marinoi.AAC.4
MMPTRKSPPKHNGREEEDLKRQQQQGIEHKDKDNAQTILAASKYDVAATSARAAKSNTVDDPREFQKGETRPTAAGSGGNSRKRKLCDFGIDATSGATCQSIAQKGGKCRKHGDTCDFVDANTGVKCTKPAVRGGKCGSHGGRDTCDFVDANTGVKCTKPIKRGGKCCSHGGRDTCDFVIDAVTKAKCGNIAVRGGKCGSHGGRDTCDFVDASTKAKCGNLVVRGGKCCSHGDCNRCTCLDCSGKQCIRERVEGVGPMCLSCSNRNAECQSSGCVAIAYFGGLCEAHNVNSPTTIVLKHMDNRMKHLETLMTYEQYKVATELHALRKMLMHNNMQDKSFSVNGIIANLCVVMMNTHLTDMKYQGRFVLDDARKNWLPLNLHVHQRLMLSLKCSLRDFRNEDDYNYGEMLSAEKTHQILKAIDSALENAMQRLGGGWAVAKLGSGNAVVRARDNNLYNSAIFDREKIVVLSVDITHNERAGAERLGITYLAGLGMSANLQLVRSIPMPNNQASQPIRLYMMFSRFQSTSVHFAESGIHHGGLSLPPGAALIPSSESPPTISEQLNENQTQDSGDDSPGNADRTLRSSSPKKDTSKKIRSSHKAETIEDVSAPKSSKETAASSVDFHAKMTDEIDEEDEESSGI